MKAASAAAGARAMKPWQKQKSEVSDLLKELVQVSIKIASPTCIWSDVSRLV